MKCGLYKLTCRCRYRNSSSMAKIGNGDKNNAEATKSAHFVTSVSRNILESTKKAQTCNVRLSRIIGFLFKLRVTTPVTKGIRYHKIFQYFVGWDPLTKCMSSHSLSTPYIQKIRTLIMNISRHVHHFSVPLNILLAITRDS